jgi:hypothetical protein
MRGDLERFRHAFWRAASIFEREGPRGLLARVARRLSSDERRVFARYPDWVRSVERTRPPRRAEAPLVSVITPVKDPPVDALRATARSVLGQRDARVEWCVADDASAREEVRRELSRLEARDARVKVVRLASPKGIAGATNAALGLARGSLVAFVDHDDVLHEDALGWIAPAFDDAAVGAAYSDEDKLDASGERFAPFLKPGFSADLLLSTNYVSHLFVARHDLVRELGGVAALDGAQDYDLALRLSERARIAHVPRVLYHWRALPGSTASDPAAKPWAHDAALEAVRRALARRGGARVEPGPWLGTHRVVHELTHEPSIAVVVTGDGPLGERARAAKGDVLLFADAALEPEPDALRELARHALRRDVALVTPRVVGWHGRLEAAGLALGFGRARLAACPFSGRSKDDPGYFGLARLTRDVSAAPGWAFAIERSKLEQLGGVRQELGASWLGVDLALRARAAGLRTIFAGESLLVRRASVRLVESEPARARAVLGELGSDPHLSPHFVRGRTRLELPRRRRA